MESIYGLWRLTEDEQRAFLGEDIGKEHPIIVVELDEQSMGYFYNERFAEPFEIVGNDAPSIRASKDRTRSRIHGLAAVSVQIPVVNLAFVAVHFFPGNATEKNTGVQVLTV